MRCRLKFRAAGESGLLVELAQRIDEEANREVLRLFSGLDRLSFPGIKELVPAYGSLLVIYDPAVVRLPALRRQILRLWRERHDFSPPPARLFRVPVLYGGACGPDLDDVARRCGLCAEEVIARHSAPRYRVYMLGFTPGFCYLGGMDRTLTAPRLANPRVKIFAGSVGIAGEQTGIYSVDSPGGWRLIGRTPLRLFDPGAGSPFLFRAGDYLAFYPVNRETYRLLAEQAAQGRLSLQAEEVDRAAD